MEADRPSADRDLSREVLITEGATLGLALADAVVTSLTHNTIYAVTEDLHRIEWAGGSAVRKVLTPTGSGAEHWAASDDPGHFNYWRRELEVYRSGFPAQIGLGAPDFYGAIDLDDGSVALWLERVEGSTGRDLSVAMLAETARVLGRSQGRADSPRPPWLSRRFLRTYSASKPAALRNYEDDARWDHPLIAACWPASIRDDFRAMLDNLETLLAQSESLPRVVAHLDVWPNNIVMKTSGEPAFLDWAFVGDGSVGEDIGNLIPDAVLDLLVPSDRLPELEASVFDAYLEGLVSAGWSGDAETVRLGMHTAAIKYYWLAPLLLDRVDDPEH
ncbi:MAG: aminoglycoside phosphotransferase, partial [Acidimicrobiales bacterium]|nr:aminoglycoside phosphotransferase [Acidimicrobiales bacterium]